MKRFAFTLSEVLIVVLIIGTVAALTMRIVEIINNREHVVELEKAYSTIAQATEAITTDTGINPVDWLYSGDLSDSTKLSTIDSSQKEVVNMYCKKLLLSACPNQMENNSPKNYIYLNNGENAKGPHKSGNSLFDISYLFKLYNGMYISIAFPQNLSGGRNQDMTDAGIPALFTADVNGEKGPNKVGRDVFFFIINNKTGKVVPYGTDDTSDCKQTDKGLSCAAYLFRNGWKMDY